MPAIALINGTYPGFGGSPRRFYDCDLCCPSPTGGISYQAQYQVGGSSGYNTHFARLYGEAIEPGFSYNGTPSTCAQFGYYRKWRRFVENTEDGSVASSRDTVREYRWEVRPGTGPGLVPFDGAAHYIVVRDDTDVISGTLSSFTGGDESYTSGALPGGGWYFQSIRSKESGGTNYQQVSRIEYSDPITDYAGELDAMCAAVLGAWTSWRWGGFQLENWRMNFAHRIRTMRLHPCGDHVFTQITQRARYRWRIENNTTTPWVRIEWDLAFVPQAYAALDNAPDYAQIINSQAVVWTRTQDPDPDRDAEMWHTPWSDPIEPPDEPGVIRIVNLRYQLHPNRPPISMAAPRISGSPLNVTI